MRRFHAFELEDQGWFPEVVRDAGVAYLRAGADWTGQVENIRPVVESALERSGETEILDLCSGGGGPVISIARRLREQGRDIRVTMTDLFPSVSAQAVVAAETHLHYDAQPVNATAVPANRDGLWHCRASFLSTSAEYHTGSTPGVRQKLLASLLSKRAPPPRRDDRYKDRRYRHA